MAAASGALATSAVTTGAGAGASGAFTGSTTAAGAAGMGAVTGTSTAAGAAGFLGDKSILPATLGPERVAVARMTSGFFCSRSA